MELSEMSEAGALETIFDKRQGVDRGEKPVLISP